MSYQYVPVDRQSESPAWVNTAITAGVAVVSMTVVYSALSFITAPAAPTYYMVNNVNAVRAPRVAPLNAGGSSDFQSFIDKAFAKSTSAAEGWVGGEEDLKGPAGSATAQPAAPARGRGRQAAPKEEPKKGLFGWGK